MLDYIGSSGHIMLIYWVQRSKCLYSRL